MSGTGSVARWATGIAKVQRRGLGIGGLMALLAALVCALSGCSRERLEGHEQNLLFGKHPTSSKGITHAERLTDGEVPMEGDSWLTSLSSVFEHRDAEVVYDLGRVMDVRGAMLVADNNDRFMLAISEDGQRYANLWSAGTAEGVGMRDRTASELSGRGRYVRVRARGGDRSVSIGELMLFAQVPTTLPPEMVRLRGYSPLFAGVVLAWTFFACVLLFALLAEAKASTLVRFVRTLSLAAAAYALFAMVKADWPPPEGVVEVLRATVALAALVLLLRGAFRHEHSEHRQLRLGLMLCAFASIACFYNFFAPQFDYADKGRKTYVHTWDMRVYYPIAKYFDALGFDGLYFASVAAYRSHGPGLSDAALSRVHLRDLRTNLMTTGDKVKDAIDAAPARFAPGDYDRFAEDMRFFWETMGGGYLASLRDHGGNATPAWFALTHYMFKFTHANEATLLVAAAIDPILLLIFAIAVWRTFGPMTALMCLIIFGTTEFPQFGSNWAGSTLRLDWMVSAGLSACALKTRRDGLAGVLLAVSGLIRAFPAMCAIVACVAFVGPVVFRGGLHARVALKRLGAVAIAGLLTVGVALAVSSATFGWEDSWGRWFEKIEMHTGEPNVNHIGLRTVLATDTSKTPRMLARAGDKDPWGSWQQHQLDTFAARKPVFYGLVAFYLLMTMFAAMRNRPEQAAVMGLLMVPLLFYPANYYMHGIFILPMMAVESARGTRFTRGRHVAPVLLVWCAAQYLTYVGTQTDERFYWQSMQFLVATVLLIAPLCLGRTDESTKVDTTVET